MAAVWLARLHGKHGFQKLFAIKDDPPAVRRGRALPADVPGRGAHRRRASRIPFVAQILDLGEERGILYIVMEWVDGDSLAKLLRTVLNGRSSGSRSTSRIRICADVAGALHAAHELRDNVRAASRRGAPRRVALEYPFVQQRVAQGHRLRHRQGGRPAGAGDERGDAQGQGDVHGARAGDRADDTDRRADVWALAGGACTPCWRAASRPSPATTRWQTLHRLTGGGAAQSAAVERAARGRRRSSLRALHPDMETAHADLRALAAGAGRDAQPVADADHLGRRGGLRGALPRGHRRGAARHRAARARHGLGAGRRRGERQRQRRKRLRLVERRGAEATRASSSRPSERCDAPFAVAFCTTVDGIGASEPTSYANAVSERTRRHPAQATPCKVTGSSNSRAGLLGAGVSVAEPDVGGERSVRVVRALVVPAAASFRLRRRRPTWVLVIGGVFALSVLAVIGHDRGLAAGASRRDADRDDSPTLAGGATRDTPAPASADRVTVHARRPS